MESYKKLIEDILTNGEVRENRTGIDTISVFGRGMEFDLREGFPAVTTKKLAWKAVWTELIWFLSGSSNERDLCQLVHKKISPEKRTIWTDNVENFGGDRFDAGRIYGVQWRSWADNSNSHIELDDMGNLVGAGEVQFIDQISVIIDKLRNNPDCRRIILNSWDVGDIQNNRMALPPCHVLSQFYVNGDGELSCSMYQRSVDTFLGLPFNIASYALLTHILASITGYSVGRLIWNGGDCHIYENHVEQCKEILKRDPLSLPKLNMLSADGFETIDEYIRAVRQTWKTRSPFVLEGYESHGELKGKMAV